MDRHQAEGYLMCRVHGTICFLNLCKEESVEESIAMYIRIHF